MKLPKFPVDAPFSADQKSWLSGFLAGVKAVQTSTVEASKQSKNNPDNVLNILFGTQTGNAEGLALETADVAKTYGLDTKVQGLDEVDIKDFQNMKNVIVSIATYGEGEMPDNAELFWKDLVSPEMPKLPEMRFGVLALGDTGYDEFCQAGKLIDMRLEQLGASRIISRQDCDVDYEDIAASWISDAVPKLTNNLSHSDPGEKSTRVRSEWNRKNPFPARLSLNKLLSKNGSGKEIRHYEVDISDSGIEYSAGDVINVLPINNSKLVSLIIERLDIDPSYIPNGKEQSLEVLLTSYYEISTPGKKLVTYLEEKLNNESLSKVAKNSDKQALSDYLWGKDILDLLNIDPDFHFDVDEFLSNLKPLQHRAYSISSSPKKYPDSVHMTISSVRWLTNNRDHLGVCSTYLADRVNDDQKVKIFMSPNKAFRIPENHETPMIMVGPGTGIAPFRAFLDEREIIGASGQNWLFFGDQTREFDFIYENEFSEKLKKGILTKLDLAFSRDQDEKIYVQDRMLESSAELFRWLEKGAYFYVCGDALRMAKDVDATLRKIIEMEGNMTSEKADAYVNNLKREKRYLRDVY